MLKHIFIYNQLASGFNYQNISLLVKKYFYPLRFQQFCMISFPVEFAQIAVKQQRGWTQRVCIVSFSTPLRGWTWKMNEKLPDSPGLNLRLADTLREISHWLLWYRVRVFGSSAPRAAQSPYQYLAPTKYEFLKYHK